jgi:hypothetical protein
MKKKKRNIVLCQKNNTIGAKVAFIMHHAVQAYS